MPVYDANGNLKILSVSSASSLDIYSGSNDLVNQDVDFLTFSGSAVQTVEAFGSGVVITLAGDDNAVDSVFGRTGAVTADAGDYDADQVDYDNATSGLIATDVQDAIDEVAGAIVPLTAVAPVDVTKTAAVVGAATTAARSDHKHDVATAAPVSVGSSNTEGSSTSLARADHVHAHGDQAGGSLHADATTAVSGFMSGADKLKLDGIAAGAQVNTVTSVHGRTGAVVAVSGDYTPSLLPVLTTGAPTGVADLEAAYRRIWSAGSVSGFDLVDNGDGTVTIAAGEGMLRIAAASDAELRSVSCPGGSPTLANNAVSYIYFGWNGGTPQLGVTTSVTGFNCQDACLLYTIAREGNILSIFDGRRMGVDGNRKLRRQMFETDRLRRVQGGTTLGDAGTRRITVTAGAFYYALNRLDHVAFDTTVAGTALANVFTYRYRNGSGGWTTINDVKQINNTQYDNGTGTLATLGNNRYRTDWVYLIPGDNARLIVVLGRNESNGLAAAQAVSPPSDLPPLVASSGVLIGRVVILRDATEIASVASAFDVSFVFSPVVAHADLSGLQGGGVGERYHLNLAQHTDAVAVSAVGNDRIVYRDPAGDIVGLDPASLGGGGGLPYVSGFSAGPTAADQDFYVAATDMLNVPTFTMVAMVRPRSPLSHQAIIGSGSEWGGDGHYLTLETGILRGWALDSTGDPVASLAWLGERTFGRWMFVALKKVTFGADWVNMLVINGTTAGEEYRVSGGGARASNVLAIGASFNGLGRAAEHLEIGFCGLTTRDVPNAELAAWFSQIVDNIGFVNAPGGLDHAWLAEDAGGATWEDAIGSANLTRTGTAGTISTGTRALHI